MITPNYTREGLHKDQKEILIDCLKADIAEARAYLQLCREAPSDEPYTNGYNEETIKRDELEEKEPLLDYLEGKGEDWSEKYIKGYLKAYARAKREALKGLFNATIQHRDLKTMDETELAELNTLARRLTELSRLIYGSNIKGDCQE